MLENNSSWNYSEVRVIYLQRNKETSFNMMSKDASDRTSKSKQQNQPPQDMSLHCGHVAIQLRAVGDALESRFHPQRALHLEQAQHENNHRVNLENVTSWGIIKELLLQKWFILILHSTMAKIAWAETPELKTNGLINNALKNGTEYAKHAWVFLDLEQLNVNFQVYI